MHVFHIRTSSTWPLASGQVTRPSIHFFVNLISVVFHAYCNSQCIHELTIAVVISLLLVELELSRLKRAKQIQLQV